MCEDLIHTAKLLRKRVVVKKFTIGKLIRLGPHFENVVYVLRERLVR